MKIRSIIGAIFCFMLIAFAIPAIASPPDSPPSAEQPKDTNVNDISFPAPFVIPAKWIATARIDSPLGGASPVSALRNIYLEKPFGVRHIPLEGDH